MSTTHAPGLTIWQQAALKCLEHAVRRDAEKGGDGLRSSIEVAEYVGITTTQARSVLYALSDPALVDCYKDKPLAWKITDAGRAALARAESRS